MKRTNSYLTLVTQIVEYYNANESTVRQTADHFGISKSTVHTYLTKVLPNPTSKAILERNRKEAHYRGGLATKNRYKKSV